MNEFIVWDKTKSKFSELKAIEFFKGGFVINPRDLSTKRMDKQLNENECELFPYIGKTDIDNEKIYADCSIVEFEYYFTDGWDEDMQGVFKYLPNELRYEIQLVNDGCHVSFQPSYIRNLKIIDTIQENKLGLIVWKHKYNYQYQYY